MTKPWLIGELAHAGTEHLDPSLVAGFDRQQGYPDLAEDLTRAPRSWDWPGQHPGRPRRRDRAVRRGSRSVRTAGSGR
jgi:hypothetical protein